MINASHPIPRGRRAAALLFALGLLVVAGCSQRNEQVVAEEDAGAARSAVPVVVRELQPSKFQVTVELSGSTEAIQEVDISAEVGGTVKSFPHELGAALSAGELILRVDTRPYRAGVDQAKAGLLAAEANFKQARRELDRARQLKEKDRISDAEYEGMELVALQAESGFHAARAAMELAEIQLEHAEIRAPFAGQLAFKGVEEGEQIGPGMPVTSVIDLSGILIRSSVSERDAVRIREDMEVNVFIPALAEERFSGRVRALGVRSNPLTRSFDIEIELPNPEGRILSGMAARGSVIVDRRQGVLTIPTSAVVDQYGEPVVFVVKESQAERRPVKLGMRSGDRVVVSEGLAAGERLIIKGQWSVKDGMTVEVKD